MEQILNFWWRECNYQEGSREDETEWEIKVSQAFYLLEEWKRFWKGDQGWSESRCYSSQETARIVWTWEIEERRGKMCENWRRGE